MAKIVLAGYLGCGNLGDDAVMLGLVEGLGAGHEYIILTGNPDFSYQEYGDAWDSEKGFQGD